MGSIRFLLLALFLGTSTAHACYQSENMEGEGCTIRADVTYNSQGSVKVRRIGDGRASQALFYFAPYEFIAGTSLPSYESYLPYAVRDEIESDFYIYIIDFYNSQYLQDKSYAAASAIRKIQELDGFRSNMVLEFDTDTIMTTITPIYGIRAYYENIPETSFISTLSAMDIDPLHYGEPPSTYYSEGVNETPFDNIYIIKTNSRHLDILNFDEHLINEIEVRLDLA